MNWHIVEWTAIGLMALVIIGFVWAATREHAEIIPTPEEIRATTPAPADREAA